MRLSLLLIPLAILAACGGKPRVAVVAPPAPAAVDSPAPAPTTPVPGDGHSVRVLLQSGFTQLEIRGSRRADRIWVEARNGNLTLRPASGDAAALEQGTGFQLRPPAGGSLRVAGTAYRGALEVFLNPLGVAVLVNELDLEDYLRGVVPNELGPGPFPFIEALKAQAVAARTFAVRHRGARASQGFDVFDDSRSQVYGGSESEQPLSDAAVAATRGIVASYGGEPIWALYSSTCGGLTEDFQFAFQGPSPPYLRGGASCRDERSRYHRWEEEFGAGQLADRLDPSGALGPLEDLRIVRRSPTGRAAELHIIGRSRSLPMTGARFRTALGLRSTAIDELEIRRSGSHIESVEVRGRGWGHGVGLCQIGAVDLASRGAGYRQILQHYYSGIELTGSGL